MRTRVIAFCVLLAAGVSPRGASAESVKLPDCLVSLIQEVQVPAQEAGVLEAVAVKEGQQVKAGDLLAKIDDTHARMQLRVAGFKLAVAKEEAANDVHVRYATAAAKVTEAEYLMNVEANRKVPGSVAKIELRKLLLTHRRTVLEIEQARMNQRIAGLEAQVSQAEVDAAQENLRRRRITSPLNAVVVELYRHAGEWVQPGDPVMHIVQVDRLRIEGFLNAEKVSPGEVDGQPVTVAVQLAHGRAEEFEGKIVFVSLQVQAGGEYQVWAEVDNCPDRQSGRWLLRPGLPAKMTIQLK